DLGAAAPAAGFMSYWRMIRRRKGTLLIFAVVGALVGYLITIPQTPIYRARTSLEIVSLNQNFMNLKEGNPVADSGAAADSTDIQTQIKILQSASLLKRVEKKLQAAQLPAAPPTRVAEWRRLLNLPVNSSADPDEADLKFAANSLDVRAAGPT